MKLVILALGSLFLVGCATPDGYNPITGQSTQPGTYSIELDEHGALIEASTLKGGPTVEWEKTAEGSIILRINHNQEMVIQGLLEAIK